MRNSRSEVLSAAIFDELASEDFDVRFAACVAVEATVWGQGLRSCRTPVERAAWQAHYAAHLARQHTIWRYSAAEPRAAMSPDVALLGVHPCTAKRPPAAHC